MKILLINPPFKNVLMAETPKFVNENRGYNPPMGIISIATCINASTNHEAEVLDAQLLEMDYGDIKKELERVKPEIIGMAALTFTLLDTLHMAKIVKEINPNIKIVFGGPHATMFPYETIKQDAVDMVVIGEGERTFPELVENIRDEGKLRKVNGLMFKDKKGEVVVTPPRELIQDLDKIPIPDRTLTPYKKYSSVLAKRNPLTTMITSRGCPFRCTFCDRPQAGGKSWRARSPKLVVDEMEQIKNLGINEILFYDDTWTMDMKRAEEICNEILRRKLDMVWDIRTRVDRVTPELIELMKKAGCHRINFGVESGTEEGLKTIKKEVNLEKVEKAFRICKKVGMETLGYLMIGLPGETREQMMQTIKFAKKVKPNFCHFTVFTPFPDTEVWRNLLEKGDKSVAECWRSYAQNPTEAFDPPTANEYLSKKELFDVCNFAYKSFYFRPSYILKELSRVRSVGEFARKTKAGFKMLVSQEG
ncbi:radical SAM protein [Candidatus Woesearchaeota archaeon]|nr:radical SAM protein [Candidatus Woesearchaeota archaeon]